MRGLLLVLAMTLTASMASATQAGDGGAANPETAIYFATDDAEMTEAVKQARAALPVFWRLFESDPVVGETGCLKMSFAVPNSKNVETMWLKDIHRDGEIITGVLDNIPDAIPGLKDGDTVTIDPAQIVDWSYMRDGRMYGSYTTRVMLKHLSSEEADEFRALLSDRPLEGSDI